MSHSELLKEIKNELKKQSSKKKAKISQRFFKTSPGEYGEGDIFLGVKVPEIRKISRQYQNTASKETVQLLKSPIHEERLLALLILILKYVKGSYLEKEKIYRLYLSHTKYINNWDLVDLTAGHIVGAFLMDKDKKILYKLAKSKLLWERRIAIVSTFYFIKNHKFIDTLRIAKILILDKEDLIHKAVGWMLREIGKRNMVFEESFLKEHYKIMPRIMLRYAIERFPEGERQSYLKSEI